ncbi:MAG TPA: alpha/beta fold hydrolase [Solirubrobacteraceae bacterium]|nr:alpha/beta fold hydrolase [Solirubrobacteraceae bacterium]
MSEAREYTTELCGTRLRVRETGSGPPLLLINGIGAHMAMWSTLERHLRGFRLIQFDAPGSGRSPVPRRPISVSGLARLAIAVLDEFGIARADVLGYSMGGIVTQQLAYDAPERVRRIVLVATSPGIGGSLGDARAMLNIVTPARYLSAQIYERTIGSMAGGRARYDRAWVSEQGALRLRHAPPLVGYFWQLAGLTGWSGLPLLGDIEQPVLVVCGDDDPLTPVANGMLIAHMVQRGRLMVLPDEGHLLLMDPHSGALPPIRAFLAAPDHSRSEVWRSALAVQAWHLRLGLAATGWQLQPFGLLSAWKRRRWLGPIRPVPRAHGAADEDDRRDGEDGATLRVVP